MPELPEVRNAVYRLNKAVNNQVIEYAFINNTKLVKGDVNTFKTFVKERKILSVTNFGKFILFNLDENKIILNHLRMTGKWRFEKIRDERKHDHIIFKTSKGFIVFNDSRAFGTFEMHNKETIFDKKPLTNLGKEPNEVDLDWLFEKFKNKKIAIKSALLDQHLVLGLGNIYVNEVLFKAKVNPERPSNQIPRKLLKEILHIAHEIMEVATKEGGSSITDYESFNGEKGNYQNFLEVHKREKLPCKKCGKEISKMYIGGRGTYWCTNCQNK